jgi:hypothetical protein
MNEQDLEHIRAITPPLSPARRQEMEERLMTKIENEDGQHRRRAGLIAAAMLVVMLGALGTVWAVMTDESPDTVAAADGAEPTADTPLAITERERAHPDPADVAQVVKNNEFAFEMHGADWRPELEAESVWCAVPEVEEPAWAAAYRFPMEDAMTRADLVEACALNDWINVEGYTTEGAEVCMADSDAPVASGIELLNNPDLDDYPMPVVAMDGRTCAETGDPMTDEDLAELNRLRSIDATLQATPDCYSWETTYEWTEAWLAEENLAHELPDRAEPEPFEDQPASYEPCYMTRIRWRSGTVDIDG